MFRKNLFYSTVLAASCVFSANASAFHRYNHDCWRDAPTQVNANFYLGFSVGYIRSNWCDLEPVFEAAQVPAGLNESSCGVRGWAQLDYTKNFGVQMGVTYIDRASYNITLPTESVDEIISMTIVDLTLTTKVAMQNNFMAFFKFGAQYSMVKNGLTINTDNVPVSAQGSDQNNFNFTCGFGLWYPFTQNLVGELAFQHFQGNPDIRCFVANVGLFSIGLGYRFGI